MTAVSSLMAHYCHLLLWNVHTAYKLKDELKKNEIKNNNNKKPNTIYTSNQILLRKATTSLPLLLLSYFQYLSVWLPAPLIYSDSSARTLSLLRQFLFPKLVSTCITKSTLFFSAPLPTASTSPS